MRRLLAMAAAAAAGMAVTPGAGAGETALGVRAEEWNLLLSRSSVSPGPAEIEYVNEGEDPHDLKIRRRGGQNVRSIAELEPSGIADLKMNLKRDSRYVMWCSTLDGKHRALGMEAELRVRKR